VPPPRRSRFGSPLVLSRVHWVRPELVAEIKYLAWTDDNLLRQVVYEGLREDKPVAEVRRQVPHESSMSWDLRTLNRKPVSAGISFQPSSSPALRFFSPPSSRSLIRRELLLSDCSFWRFWFLYSRRSPSMPEPALPTMP
jgi:hypothetical protein